MPTDYKGKIIHNMSQTKFNELLESNGGKLPAEFANSIVHTRAEDVNLSQMRMRVLWTNPNPTSAFSAQTITLNSSGYDYLLFISDLYQSSSVSAQRNTLSMTIKGRGCSLNIAADYGGAEATFYRTATYINDLQYNISGGSYRSNTTTGNSDSILVPIQIIGLCKQPAMIYTGAELHDGNGISVKDGVVGIVPAQSPSLNTTKVGQNDTVVEYYVSSDATTWYRKWASGWKECGGCFMSAANSSGVYVAFPITFEQSVHAIQFTDTESAWNAQGCIPKALYWPGHDPANYDGKAGMRVLTPALNTGATYAAHRISYYAQGY